ncbi:hypothetical protein [Bacillus sp. FJAT-45350]|uniref:hypothetical protein n=1 Tax=Bacillus sp. FJAT-45350 TaxID=2011014 RepID=UPI0015C8165B|nr:hypothetical protein [Bacillus sp. FJAT-45350]
MKGIEIAKKLNISTSALIHYEDWGEFLPLNEKRTVIEIKKKNIKNIINVSIEFEVFF